jgi:uncharacterized BrkB/YihY/UPF0761 family membrane protein
VRTGTITWSLLTLFFILLGLGVYLAVAVHSTTAEETPAPTIARYVAIGCGIAAALTLGIGLLLLYRCGRR